VRLDALPAGERWGWCSTHHVDTETFAGDGALLDASCAR
jgi:hypothetical protein